MELKNRIVMSPMDTNFASPDGVVTERLTSYYSQRAKGGVGLIIVEATSPDCPRGNGFACELCIDSDRFIPGLNTLAEVIQDEGAKCAIQLEHAGRQTNRRITGGIQPVSSSNFRCPNGGYARALDEYEIEAIVEAFANAAYRAKRAGFDAVEMQGAHGYLIAQFLSPYVNKRTDSYGGDFEGRMRFALKIVERTRRKVGEDFPIIFRLSGDEYVEGGLSINDVKLIARKLEENGVDALDVSAGVYESRPYMIPPMALPKGCNVHLAEEIKKVTNIPIITVGRINDPILAEKILKEGKADLIAMGRALLADPELPRKAAEGKLDDIRKCVGCLRGCSERLLHQKSISCAVNARVGKEREYKIMETADPRKILVIGGGPAGMEAARIAGLRGHKVILQERLDELGGQLILAAKAPYKEEVENLKSYLVHQLHKLDVEIQLGTEATPQTIEKVKPDIIIMATGARPIIPRIPGVNRRNVVTAWDVLREEAEVKSKVLVIGGGMVGCETAEFLANKGHDVSIVEMLDQIAYNVELRTRWLMMERFAEYPIKTMTGSKAVKIIDDGIVTIDKNSRQHLLKSDSVVLALGARPNNELANKLKEKNIKKIRLVGDCLKARFILDAINEGFHTGLKI